MINKTCMVTGATSGIGFATALNLAYQGATVIVVGRNIEKGATTLTRIQQETGNASVQFMQADLSQQDQIHHLALEFKSRYSRLDVLVNNAGAIFLRRQLSADGVEMTFAVNHLSCFLLTNLLLETLKASAPARIVNVSSGMHKSAQINFEDLEGEHKYSCFGAYGQSKLALLLFTYELAQRLEGTEVTVNALHPGFVATNLGRNNGWLAKLIVPMFKMITKGPAKGAEASIYLASSPDVAGISGKYFKNKRAVRSSSASYDATAAKRLWEVSAVMTGL
jgi:NAD(P)-dependent dehydrogenase (short-subunit alcohol dehydrogenase family)